MAISNHTLNRIYLHYKDRLEGVKISKIVKISAYDFSFILYSGKQEALIVSLEPLHPYFLVSSSYFSTLKENSLFVVYLKKYFENGKILRVEKVKNDRIIVLTIRKTTNTFQVVTHKLIVELIPHRTNAIIVDENDVILFAMKMSSSPSEERAVIKGLHYLYPESSDKEITEKDTLETLKGKIGVTSYKDILYRIEKEGETLPEILQEILQSQNYYVYKDDILSVPLHSFPSQKIDLEEISEIYERKEREKYKKQRFNQVFHLVDHKLKGLKKKLGNLEKDLAKNEKKRDYVEIGNLLFTHRDLYRKGMERICIEGKEIELNPNLGLNENAESYFRQYRKGKVALIEIRKQREITEERIEFFETIANQLSFATPEDMEDIVLELKNNGYIKETAKKKEKKKERTFSPHFIRYRECRIGFGLSSYQNDFLTFTLAKKEDRFLHIKDFPGAHVVVFSSSPDDEVLLFAGELSLFLSGKESGEVYLSKRGDIRKIPAHIGKVQFDRYTIISLHSIREETKEFLSSLFDGESRRT